MLKFQKLTVVYATKSLADAIRSEFRSQLNSSIKCLYVVFQKVRGFSSSFNLDKNSQEDIISDRYSLS